MYQGRNKGMERAMPSRTRAVQTNRAPAPRTMKPDARESMPNRTANTAQLARTRPMEGDGRRVAANNTNNSATLPSSANQMAQERSKGQMGAAKMSEMAQKKRPSMKQRAKKSYQRAENEQSKRRRALLGPNTVR